MTDNRDRPFFLYLAHNNPHIPLVVRPDLIRKTAGAFQPRLRRRRRDAGRQRGPIAGAGGSARAGQPHDRDPPPPTTAGCTCRNCARTHRRTTRPIGPARASSTRAGFACRSSFAGRARSGPCDQSHAGRQHRSVGRPCVNCPGLRAPGGLDGVSYVPPVAGQGRAGGTAAFLALSALQQPGRPARRRRVARATGS